MPPWACRWTASSIQLLTMIILGAWLSRVAKALGFWLGGGLLHPSRLTFSLSPFFLRLFLFAQGCLEPPCSLLFFGVFGQSAIHFYCPSIILAHSFSAFPGALIVYHLQQKGGWARAREEEEK